MNASMVKVSSRETEILRLMSDGFTSKEIGEQLYISNLTVDKHKRNMLTKFNARNSVQLVVHADRLGLLIDSDTYQTSGVVSNISSTDVRRNWSHLSAVRMNF